MPYQIRACLSVNFDFYDDDTDDIDSEENESEEELSEEEGDNEDEQDEEDNEDEEENLNDVYNENCSAGMLRVHKTDLTRTLLHKMSNSDLQLQSHFSQEFMNNKPIKLIELNDWYAGDSDFTECVVCAATY